jgi:hypothetical protein
MIFVLTFRWTGSIIKFFKNIWLRSWLRLQKLKYHKLLTMNLRVTQYSIAAYRSLKNYIELLISYNVQSEEVLISTNLNRYVDTTHCRTDMTNICMALIINKNKWVIFELFNCCLSVFWYGRDLSDPVACCNIMVGFCVIYLLDTTYFHCEYTPLTFPFLSWSFLRRIKKYHPTMCIFSRSRKSTRIYRQEGYVSHFMIFDL